MCIKNNYTVPFYLGYGRLSHVNVFYSYVIFSFVAYEGHGLNIKTPSNAKIIKNVNPSCVYFLCYDFILFTLKYLNQLEFILKTEESYPGSISSEWLTIVMCF